MGGSRLIRLTNGGILRLYESLANGTNSIDIKAPVNIDADYSWTLPAADANGYLASDGAGHLQFLSGTFNNQSMDDTYNFGHAITADAGAIRINDVGGLFVEGQCHFANGPWHDVKHPLYGGVGNGSADDTSAILAAYNAVDSTYGGVIFFGPGIYLLDAGQLSILKSNVTLLGYGATIKALPGTLWNHKMVSVGNGTTPVSNFSCIGLNFDGNYAQAGPTNNGDLGQTTQAHIFNLWNVQGAWFVRNYMANSPGDFIRMDYGDETNLSVGVVIDGNKFKTCTRNAISLFGRSHKVINNYINGYDVMGIVGEPDNPGETITDIMVQGNTIIPNPTKLNSYNTNNRIYSISFSGLSSTGISSSHIQVVGNQIEGLSDGGIQYPQEAIRVQKFRFFSIRGNRINQTRNGINTISSNVDSMSSGEIVDNYVYQPKAIGIQFLYNTIVRGNTVEGGTDTGFRAYHTKNIITDNIAKNCNPYGFWIEGDNNILSHNKAFDEGGGTQQYGCFMDDGILLNKITDNDFTGNTVGGIRPPPAILTNVIQRNQGFRTEAYGTGSIPSGVQTVVTHGLDWTPLLENIYILPSAQTTSNFGYWFITGITATTFLVNVRLDPGAGGFNFNWIVRERL